MRRLDMAGLRETQVKHSRPLSCWMLLSQDIRAGGWEKGALAHGGQEVNQYAWTESSLEAPGQLRRRRA